MADAPTEDQVQTMTATVFVGLRRRHDGTIRHSDEVIEACREYCTEVGLCVTVTPTTYVYKNGQEPGVAVGLINYPRFPSDREEIEGHALSLGRLLGERFDQMRVSVVFPDSTVMLSFGDPP